MASTDQIERRESLKDAAYRQIKELIVSGQLEREHLYSARHFADLLGISRTPAREALLQLASENLLVCLDVRGFKLKEFTLKEIRDVFEAREVIEPYLIGQLAGSLNKADLDALKKYLKTMSRCAKARDVHGFLEADKQFHMLLANRNDNQVLASIMDQIRDHISLFGIRVLENQRRYDEVLAEHAEILEALTAEDRKRSVAAMRRHLSETRRYLLESAAAE